MNLNPLSNHPKIFRIYAVKLLNFDNFGPHHTLNFGTLKCCKSNNLN